MTFDPTPVQIAQLRGVLGELDVAIEDLTDTLDALDGTRPVTDEERQLAEDDLELFVPQLATCLEQSAQALASLTAS